MISKCNAFRVVVLKPVVCGIRIRKSLEVVAVANFFATQIQTVFIRGFQCYKVDRR